MANKNIGKIIAIYTDKIQIELNESDKLRFNDNGFPISFRGVGDYVNINGINGRKLLYVIKNIYRKDLVLGHSENSKIADYSIAEAFPLGEWSRGKFEYGISQYPSVGNFVFMSPISEFKQLFGKSNEAFSINVGTIINDNSVNLNINTYNLFTNHLAVFGNTGSGKSTTVKEILNKMFVEKGEQLNSENVNIVIFDVHNEYKKIFSNAKEISLFKEVSIPLSELSIDDWIMLVNPSSLVQLPVLRQALKYAKVKKFSNENKASFFARFALDLFYSQSFDAAAKRQKISQYMNEIFKIKDSLISNDGNEESFELKEKIGILETTFKQYTPNYGNFISNDTEKKFVNTLEEIVGDFNLSKCLSETEFEIELIDELLSGLDYAFSHEECKGNKNIRSHCMTMLTRIEGIRDDYANNIFSNDEVKLERYMKLFEFNEAIEVIDVANVETVDLRFFSSFILSKCLRDAKQRRTNDEKQKNYNFIFDEAHIYIKEANESEGNVKNVFESIAKEGRKFGIFLQLISQRPSEVSRTVVSQCANFILHRIGNSFDLDMIKKGNPYINEDLIKRISILPSGCALFLGESFPIPIEIRIDSQDYDTSAPKINNWYK